MSEWVVVFIVQCLLHPGLVAKVRLYKEINPTNAWYNRELNTELGCFEGSALTTELSDRPMSDWVS